ncbi:MULTISPECIES: DUF262 domain-containing protein [unclassified Fibrobacter]|uniref:DUF262 domain-containing protein n=1 Tax=unclassified Fibrobacter TaxID=2634177 RepID=UPI0025C3E7D5|nr:MULTISPECIES: DUF262 domain-containing protein [unclassified Fibrobacter]
MNDHVEELSLNKIFCENSDKYIIPIYQRKYAWKYTHISQLIRDVVDYKKKSPDKNYYIGTLITFQRDDYLFEVIDGQQRLTTLSLLLDALKHDKKVSFTFNDILDFDSRKDSSDALRMLYSKPLDNKEDYATEICEGYDNAIKALGLILSDEELSFEEFKDYLLQKVIIFRVQVPEDTDLNHYFEIMNNRGEQLEKHEILKSYFIKCLETDKDAQYAFSEIWEKCSNLDRYIQMLFTTNSKESEKDIRSKIFGFNNDDENKWNFLQPLEAVYEALKAPNSDGSPKAGLNINQIIGKKQIELSPIEEEGNIDDTNRRFNSLITFPNFLLIVLRIKTGDSSIPLDDKQLIDSFEKYVKDASVEFVKDFGYCLLRCKFLFDKFIIKREGDAWSLSKLYFPSKRVNYKDTTFAPEGNGPEISRITQLLSVFHVSVPSQGYKYWIYAALKFFYEKDEKALTATEYLNFLENLAKAYFFDRYVATNSESFEQIIDQNNSVSINSDLNWKKLDKGVDVDNFVFNYMDYLLWTDCKYVHKYIGEGKEIKTSSASLINAYQFGYHSSVEHYYPRHPIDDPDHTVSNVDNFGNLCLISGGDNSRLSNHLPKAKKDFYSKPKDGQKASIDSIKQRLMMDYEEWNEDSINKHGALMKKILADRTLIGD